MHISVAQNTINFFPYRTINLKVTQLVEEQRENPEGRGFVS
jgi:hypothetical protein